MAIVNHPCGSIGRWKRFLASLSIAAITLAAASADARILCPHDVRLPLRTPSHGLDSDGPWRTLFERASSYQFHKARAGAPIGPMDSKELTLAWEKPKNIQVDFVMPRGWAATAELIWWAGTGPHCADAQVLQRGDGRQDVVLKNPPLDVLLRVKRRGRVVEERRISPSRLELDDRLFAAGGGPPHGVRPECGRDRGTTCIAGLLTSPVELIGTALMEPNALGVGAPMIVQELRQIGVGLDDHNPRALSASGLDHESTLHDAGLEPCRSLQHSADLHLGHASLLHAQFGVAGE